MEVLSTNAKAFSSALMQLSNKVDSNAKAIIKKACFDLYRAIVRRTPVDTGRAKGSWGIGVTHSSDVLPPGENPAMGMVGDATEGLFTFQLSNDEVVIYNNLEYISFLESGSSAQAPAGMVAISLAEFEAHFRKALATQEVFV